MKANGWWAALALGMACTGVPAAVYKCGSGSSIYYSDKPCSGGTSGTLEGYGPLQPQSSGSPNRYGYGSGGTSLPRAPDHLKYLSGACATLNDAIRTAPSRGVGFSVVQELNYDYQRKCSEEDMQARARLQEDIWRERGNRLEQRKQAEAVRKQTEAERQQCDSMREILQMRRKREETLNPTDLAALRQFENSYNERCLQY